MTAGSTRPVPGPRRKPRRGDLAYDTGSERIGVVTALPEDTGTAAYQLVPEDGGHGWTALGNRLALVEPDREEHAMTLTAPEPTDTAVEPRDPRQYVSLEVWDREIQLLMRDYPFDEVMATRLFGAAISYLITAIEKWGQGLEMCCGRIVDIAVHVFILDTRNYREFCAAHFDGRFLEHIPEIAFKYDGSVERTARIIADNGFAVDWKLWEADYAKCGPCRPGEECH